MVERVESSRKDVHGSFKRDGEVLSEAVKTWAGVNCDAMSKKAPNLQVRGVEQQEQPHRQDAQPRRRLSI